MATGYGKPLEFTLDLDLQVLGWSSIPDDYCWLACESIGYRLRYMGYSIVLCVDHIRELESSAKNGYSQADPPKDSPPEPKMATHDGSIKWMQWRDKYWWPWRLET